MAACEHLSQYLRIGAASTPMGDLWVDVSSGPPHVCLYLPGALPCSESWSASYHWLAYLSQNWQSYGHLLDLGGSDVNGKSAWCSRPSAGCTAGLLPDCPPTHLLFSQPVFHWSFHCLLCGCWMCSFPASSTDFWLGCDLTHSEENLLYLTGDYQRPNSPKSSTSFLADTYFALLGKRDSWVVWGQVWMGTWREGDGRGEYWKRPGKGMHFGVR